MQSHPVVRLLVLLTLVIGGVAVATRTDTPRAEAATRSVKVIFDNKSDVNLSLSYETLYHGCWSTPPPAAIKSGTRVEWESESCGIATGTEGFARYTIQGGGEVQVYWNNPFIGSNDYTEKVNDTMMYKVERSGGGDGSNATIGWTFDCSSATCDGIPDDWKRNGVTLDPGDGSGPQFINLPAMGAQVGRTDIFIHIDWMADANHTHKLDTDAIKKVVEAFAQSPYRARNGSTGINLHVDQGADSIMNFATNQTWGSLSRARAVTHQTNLGTHTRDAAGNDNYDWTAVNAIRNAPGGFRSSGRERIFHYLLSMHMMSTLSNFLGLAPTPGTSILLAMGPLADNSLTTTDPTCPTAGPGNATVRQCRINQQAGDFMHELGHNLSLDHGGDDEVNFKPNYFSVMNYFWVLTGLIKNGQKGVMDYSRQVFNLSETSLNETTGVDPGAAAFLTLHWCPATATFTAPLGWVPAKAAGPIDWNCHLPVNESGYAFDVNNDGARGTLFGHDDWRAVRVKVGMIGQPGLGSPPNPEPLIVRVESITPQQAALVARSVMADLAVSLADSPDPVGAGGALTYTLTVTNRGQSPATLTAAKLVLPAGVSHVSNDGGCVQSPAGTLTCATGDLARGEQKTITVQTLVAADLVHNAGGPVTVSAKATVTQQAPDDPDTANNEATATTKVVAMADLEVVSVVAVTPPAEMIIGQPQDLTVRSVATNNGPSAPIDTALTLTATASAGLTVSPATVSAAESGLKLKEQRARDQVYRMQCVAPGVQTLTLTTEIKPAKADDIDPNPANNKRELKLAIECVVPVAINIKPHSNPNSFNLNGAVPVAVLTTRAGEYGLPLAFDATRIDVATVRFGPRASTFAGGGALDRQGRGSIEDSYEPDDRTRDGDLDMVFQFEAALTGLTTAHTEACVKGVFVDPQGRRFKFFGCDVIVLRPS